MDKKMSVLVLGNSGVGKSTLISSLSDIEALTGTGEGVTQNITVYESNNWPIKFIDTKGFEYSLVEQLKTIHQIKKFTRSQIKNSKNDCIDAVWYCIDGTSRRNFKHNIDLMNKAIRNWKNIPIFVVITKSYSKIDIPENIELIKKSFDNAKYNLKGIIPVVSMEYKIDEEVTVEPFGIEELCVQTIECMDEAKDISDSNIKRMILNQKRFTSQAIISGATASAVAVALVPLPSLITDSTLLVPIEVAMTKSIFKVYGIKYSEGLIDKIIGGTAITIIAKQIVQAIPIVGIVVNAIVAGSVVLALGEGVVTTSELIYSGKLEQEKIDDVVASINEKVLSNSIVSVVATYFEKNKDSIKDKKPKEIVEEILKMKKN